MKALEFVLFLVLLVLSALLWLVLQPKEEKQGCLPCTWDQRSGHREYHHEGLVRDPREGR